MGESEKIDNLLKGKTENLLKFEKLLYAAGYRFVAGVDEAGRGPLAGPVVAAACILPPKFDLPGLKDSKKLTEKKREFLSQMIQQQALAYSFGMASVAEIDLLNILQATKLAMKRAIEKLPLTPDYILVDGRDNLDIQLPHKPIIDGDSLSASIAAASILAKVARDKIMCDLHQLYPQYSFDLHKGYCTKLHLTEIEKYGPCPVHRKSFAPIKDMIRAN